MKLINVVLLPLTVIFIVYGVAHQQRRDEVVLRIYESGIVIRKQFLDVITLYKVPAQGFVG